MALRRLAPLFAAVGLLLAAAPALAPTDVDTLLAADTCSVTGIGTGGSFAYGENCQVKVLTPFAGVDTRTTQVVAGMPCGQASCGVQATSVSATTIGLDLTIPLAGTPDGGMLIGDRGSGIVHKYVNGQLQTLFGDGTCSA